jgi:hypothetical protein
LRRFPADGSRTHLGLANRTTWTIVFGVLADSHDRAYAYTTHGRYQLQTAAIPARFRAAGVAPRERPQGRLIAGVPSRSGLIPAIESPGHSQFAWRASHASDRGRRDAQALAGQPQPVLLPQLEHV